MPQTRVTHSQANLAIQINLFDENGQGHSTAFSARYRGTQRADRLSQEDGYLVKWLASRLEPTTLTLREESALTALPSDQRQIARLLGIARERRLLDHFDAVIKMVGGRAVA